MYQFNREEYEKRVAWFTQARFGMFIHLGLYAIPARGEWVRSVCLLYTSGSGFAGGMPCHRLR